ncbi:MAG TPA: PilZ domain-containing protein [Gemmataceae bacterium]|nr:PilZ domain-containing protein [Gemmataceae bacterium]
MSHWKLDADTKILAETTALERRRAARHRCNVRAQCRPFGKSREALFGIVQDVSAAGIRLTLDESFPKGTILELTVLRRNGEIVYAPHLIRVRRATKQSEGRWLIGASFVKQRSQEELRKFLSWSDRYDAVARVQKTHAADEEQIDPFIHGSVRERRKASRRKGSAVTVQIIQAVAATVLIDGWVTDRSCSGICVSLGRAFPLQAKLKVRAIKSGQVGTWVQAIVKSCRRLGSRWMVGCEWQTQMPAAVLQMFG